MLSTKFLCENQNIKYQYNAEAVVLYMLLKNFQAVVFQLNSETLSTNKY